MSQYELIEKEWKKSSFPEPEVKILICGDNLYAVVEDRTDIIIVASKSEVIYAIARNRIGKSMKEKIPIYTLESSKYLKIVSCTKETIEKRHKDQYFVINKIINFV